MATDVSVVFKGDSQQFTNSTKQASDAARRLDSDVKQTQRTLDTFAAAQKKMDAWQQWQRASEALKQYQRDIKNAKYAMDDATKNSLSEQAASVEKLKAAYQQASKELSNLAKQEANTRDEMSKTDNDLMQRSGGSGGMGGGIGATLIRMRMYAQLGQAAQDYVFALGKSMYGERTGSALSNIAGGALSGFTMGAYTGNPVVMAAGAGVGAATGVVKTATERMEKRDDAFRAEVERLYDTVTQDRETALTAGIEYASTEESNLRAMGVLLSSQEKGNELYAALKEYGVNTMYQTPNMLTAAKRMLAYGVQGDDIMQAVQWIGDVAMGDQSKFDALAYVYGQTVSAGKLTGQDLRQYTEAGFNPLTYLAKERGVTLEDMRELMSKGEVSAADVQHAFEIATSEGEKFYKSAENMMSTYAGKTSKLADLQDIANSGYGVGYNEEREKGLDYEIEQYEGKFGDSLKRANELVGAYEADLENQHQQMLIDYQQAVMDSEVFQQLAETDAPEAGRMLAEARAQAEIDWNNSEGMQLKREQELALIQSIGQDAAINGAYIEYGIAMADAFTVGWNGQLKENLLTGAITEDAYMEQTARNGNILGLISQKGLFGALGWINKKNYYDVQGHEKVQTVYNTPQKPIYTPAQKAETNITESQTNNQTFNISTSVTVNEATDGAKIANMIAATVGKGISSTATKAAIMPKFTLRRGH